MVRERISEMDGDESDDEDPPQPDEQSDTEGPYRTEAVTEAEREEFNELFDLLNSNGYMTLGDYSLQYNDEYEMQIVTFSAALPSSNDWDPSMAYQEDE